jgi:hypothetical protein
VAERRVSGEEWGVYTAAKEKKRAQPTIVGRLESGRPIVLNPDGTYSTHRNMIASFDDGSYVIPTMYGGKEVSEDQAVALLKKNKGVDPDTGQPMPRFDSDDEAMAFEKQQHDLLEEEIMAFQQRQAPRKGRK